MAATKYFEISMKRSSSGRPDKHRKVLAGLGLRRFGQTVFLRDTPETRGMLYKIVHLVQVQPMEGEMPLSSRAKAKQAAEAAAS